MKVHVPVAIVLMLAVGAQAGSSQHVLEGSAVSVNLAGSASQLQGTLGAVDVVGADSGNMAFHVEGAIQMEADHEHFEGYGVTGWSTDSGTDRSNDTFASVDGTLGRENRQLVVFPFTGAPAQVYTGPASVSVATPSNVAVHMVSGAERSPESVPAQGLRVTGGGVEVRGTFAVALWEWDFDAVGSDGTASSHWTGVRTTPVYGLPPETTPALHQEDWQQAFLVVTDGVLSIPAEGKAVAYLPSGAADVHGALTFQGVHAAMDSSSVAQDISADRFSMRGDLHVELGAPADGRVPFQATGQGRPVIEVDGATLQWTGRSGGWPSWATWALVGLAAVAAPGSALLARRGYLRWEDRRLEEAGELLEMEAYDEARAVAQPLLRSRRYCGEAAVVQVEALLSTGRAADALSLLSRERLWRLAPAVRDYMAARVHVLLGDLAQGRAALASAVAGAPDLLAQARGEPILKPLLPDLVEGYA
jgi:hypothetical protein